MEDNREINNNLLDQEGADLYPVQLSTKISSSDIEELKWKLMSPEVGEPDTIYTEEEMVWNGNKWVSPNPLKGTYTIIEENSEEESNEYQEGDQYLK